MRSGFLLIVVSWLAVGQAWGHGAPAVPEGVEGAERQIQFPDVPGYLTIILDPHTHSVFSDGHVWPRIRVEEALRDGLDAMAVTEHLEYQPHLADIPHPDRNRAFDETVQAAAESDLIVIRGSEITRDAPAGHINAIFLQDANDLLRVDAPDDPADVRAYYEAAGAWPAQQAVQAANDQGAFVFWNHPYWSSDFPNGIPVIPEFHIDNARDGLLHGVEIANGDSYSEETFQIALDHDLTLIGVSDVHDLIDWDYAPHAGGHRPVTLVGTIRNQSDAHFQLLNRSDLTFFEDGDLIDVPAHGTRTLQVKTPSRLSDVTLAFTVMNALTAAKENPSIRLHAPVDR